MFQAWIDFESEIFLCLNMQVAHLSCKNFHLICWNLSHCNNMWIAHQFNVNSNKGYASMILLMSKNFFASFSESNFQNTFANISTHDLVWWPAISLFFHPLSFPFLNNEFLQPLTRFDCHLFAYRPFSFISYCKMLWSLNENKSCTLLSCSSSTDRCSMGIYAPGWSNMKKKNRSVEYKWLFTKRKSSWLVGDAAEMRIGGVHAEIEKYHGHILRTRARIYSYAWMMFAMMQPNNKNRLWVYEVQYVEND